MDSIYLRPILWSWKPKSQNSKNSIRNCRKSRMTSWRCKRIREIYPNKLLDCELERMACYYKISQTIFNKSVR
ncbi:hypothetical protein SAY86_017508 [Trapa natans]|uniref:Uncharacterized protein n=1 Tax=Trapa natans TaxID=22666 RepID=A0AAN7R2S2_TRANT|nr:hypothetical protein SAY86_017508 [Trapa natans]